MLGSVLTTQDPFALGKKPRALQGRQRSSSVLGLADGEASGLGPLGRALAPVSLQKEGSSKDLPSPRPYPLSERAGHSLGAWEGVSVTPLLYIQVHTQKSSQ